MTFTSHQKLKVLVHSFLFVLFVFMPFVFSDGLLEKETTLRYLLSGILMAVAYMAIVRLYFQGSITLPSFTSGSLLYRLLVLFVFISAIALSRAINTGEALYEFLKIITASSFLLLFIIFYSNYLPFLTTLCKYASIAVASFTIIALSQVGNSLALHNHFNIDFTLASSLGNKNFYGETMLLFLPLSILGIVYSQGFWRWFSALNVIAILATLITLQTLSTWVGMAVFLFIFILFFILFFDKHSFIKSISTKQRQLLVAASILVLVSSLLLIFRNTSLIALRVHHLLAYLLHPRAYSSVDSSNVNSIAERISLWKNAWRVFKDHPLFGCGAENWKILAPKYGLPFNQFSTNSEIRYVKPHNDWLLILAEQGLVGLVIYMSLFFTAIMLSWRMVRHTIGNSLRFTFAMLGAGVVLYMVVATFSMPSSRFYTVLLLMLFFALITIIGNPSAQSASPRRSFLWLGLMVLATFNGIAISYISASRYRSEVHLIYALQGQSKSDWHKMAYHAGQAKSYLFPLDFTATPIAWYEGRAYFASPTPSLSKYYFEEALKRNPYHLHAINDLATICDREGDTGRALKLYNQALVMAPFFSYAYMNKAIMIYNTGARNTAYQYMHQYPDRHGLYRDFMTVMLTDKLHRLVPDTATANKILSTLGSNILAIDTVATMQHKSFEAIIQERYLSPSKK